DTKSTIKDYGAVKDTVYDGNTLYWGNQTTKQFPIDTGQESITINQSRLSGEDDYMELTSGYYLIEAYYQDGSASSLCSKDTIFLVDEPDPLSLEISPIPIIENSDYHAETPNGEGKIEIKADGGRVDTIYIYKKNDGEFKDLDEDSEIIRDISDGDKIYLENSDGCPEEGEISEEVSFTMPDNLEISDASFSVPTCSEEDQTEEDGSHSDGIIEFTIAGGVGDYTVKLLKKTDNGEYETNRTKQPDSKSDSFTTLINGKYKLRITDEVDNVIESDVFDLNQEPIDATLADSNPFVCHGDEYSVELADDKSVSYSSYNLAYKESESSEYDSLKDVGYKLGAGEYDIKILNDNKKCSQVQSLTIQQPDSKLTISKSGSSPDTCKAENGSLELEVSGGWSQAGKTVSLDSGKPLDVSSDAQDVTFDGLAEGNHTVMVENDSSCTAEETFSLGKHNPLDDLSIKQAVEESCDGANNAELKIQSWELIEDDFTVKINRTEKEILNDNQIKGLSAEKDAFIEVIEPEGSRGCVYDTTMDINKLDNSVGFGSNSTTLASCETASDGSITVQGAGGPDGGYKYKIGDQDYTDEFKSQSHSFDGLMPDTFSVSIMDTAECDVLMDSIVVGYESNPVSVDAVNVDPASCANASDGAITIENIEHTDGSSMDFFWDGSQVKKVSPKKEMSFSGVDGSGLSPGTYSLELVDDNKCLYDTIIDVEHNGYQPGFSRTIEEKVACTGKTNGQVSFELEEGDADDFTFEVFDTSDFADPPVETGDVEEGTSFRVGGLTDQEYFVEVMDSNRCGDTLDFEMPLIAHSLELFSETVPASCKEVDNGELHVSAKGGFPFEDEAYQFSYKKNDSGNWESFEVDSLVVQDLSEGDYFDIKVEDKYGCVVNGDPLSIPVKENKTEIQEINTQNPACRDSLSGAAKPLMQWTPETTGYNYKLFSLNDNYEYVDTVSGVLEENNLAINDLKEGLYNLKVVDSDGCQDDMDFRLKDPEPVSVRPEHNYVRVKGENTGEFNLGLAGGNEKYEIAWSELPSEEEFANRDTVARSSYTVSGLPAGDYFVAVRDTAHCAYFDGDDWFTGKISIEEPEKEFSVVSDTIFDVSCNKLSDGRIDVEVEGGWGGYQYSLDGGESQETGTFDGLTAGEYSVEIS
ncbi:MAG: SprB repeat-containing protein, partial [Bacteroidota bacterium]